MTTNVFTNFDAERQLADALAHHGRRIFDGSTDVDMRKQRARAAIVSGDLAGRIVARRSDTTHETYSQAFMRVYGEPLIPNTPRTKP